MNEIAFNSSLMREMRAIAFVTRLIDEGALDAARYSRILIHSIRDDDRMSALGAASKFDTDWAFLSELRHAGRACADRWLAQNFEQIGRTSTVALGEVFL
jgi:NTE family protein